MVSITQERLCLDLGLDLDCCREWMWGCVWVGVRMNVVYEGGGGGVEIEGGARGKRKEGGRSMGGEEARWSAFWAAILGADADRGLWLWLE